MPVHLSPIMPATRDVILVGDPRRAFSLGQALTVQPEMSHLSRGLWGYRGVTEGGLELTVQSTGVGGPSAVAVISDLVGLGAKRLVRLGTCAAIGPDAGGRATEAGRAFLVSTAWCCDGASRALSGGETEARPDPGLFEALSEVAEPAEAVSRDLVLRMESPTGKAGGRDGEEGPDPELPEDVALRDLQTAATMASAKKLGVEAAAVLVVAEDGSGRRLEEAELEAEFRPLGMAIVRALEAISNPQPKG